MKYVVSILFFMWFHQLWTQEYTYQHDDQIQLLKQDSLGYLYLIGNTSVCKFDGKELHNSCLYLEERITDVAILAENNYLVAVNETLYHYQNQTIVNEVVLKEVITNLEIVNKHLLIGTLGSGLFTYSLTDSSLNHLEENSFINDITNSFENTYVLTDNELIQIDLDFKVTNRVKLNELLPKQIKNYGKDKLAILFDDGKVILMNSALQIQHIYQSKEFIPSEITGHNDFLFAIDNSHLKQWKEDRFIAIQKGNFEHLTQMQSLLYTSHKKNLSSQNILSKTYPIEKTFSIFTEANQFWLGREGEISIFENGKLTKNFVFPEPYKNTYVSSLVVHQGKIYAGTMGMGILIFDASNGKLIDSFQDENTDLNEHNLIRLELKNDLLWVGYLNGLKVFDIHSRELKYNYTHLLKNNYLYSFHINNASDFFLGTSDAGLVHVKNAQPTNYLEGLSVYSLVETPSGIIFSVEGEGLYQLQNSNLSKLSDEYFFRSKDIYNMVYVDGNVLFSHNLGIDILNLNEKKISYISIESLNEPQLNANAINTSKAIIGYDNGLIEFNKSLLDEIHQDKLTINTPLLFNEKIQDEKTEFSYQENVWTFSFEAKNYYSPSEKYYKYRLLPIEGEWISTTQEKVTYYNLPSEDYRFEVSSGGQRSFKPRHIQNFEFSISKPYWMEVWFWFISLALLIFLVYLIVKYRENQIQKKEELKGIQLQFEYQRLKDQINPHFLFNSFNSLIGIVEDNPKQAAQVLEKLSSLYRTILKHEKTKVISLFEELELTKQYFEIHKIRFQDLIHLEIPEIEDSQTKFVIPFSLQLLIENALKHNVINSKSKLVISITDEKGFLKVSNNLNKKNKKSTSLGLGLENLMKRHEMILNLKPIIEKDQNYFTVKIPYIHE